MILNDLPTVRTNLIGVILSIVYLTIFYWYTSKPAEKTFVWAQLGFGCAFLAAVFAYAEMEDKTVLVPRFGWIVTVILFLLVGSPFLGLVGIRSAYAAAVDSVANFVAFGFTG